MILDKIKSSNLESVAIFSGAGVDPDGLASALTMKYIVEKLGGSATCFYRGSFNRTQNKTMREALGLKVEHEDSAKDGNYTTVISVDGPASVCPIQPHFVIDHHKQSGEPLVASDIRQIGSCSAIMWEYAMAAGLDFETEGGKQLATALAIGILTDTNNYKVDATSQLDFEAAAYCLKYKDYKSFISILNWPKPSYYNDLYCAGWNNKIWPGTVLVTGIGDLPEGRSGVISDLAEKFLETDGVSTAVVVAMVGSEIIMSVRSSNTSLDVNEFVKTFGAGGGKKGAGVAKISLPEPIFSNVNDKNRENVFNSFYSIIVEKALEFAGDGASTEREV